jgi:hypothetical protein
MKVSLAAVVLLMASLVWVSCNKDETITGSNNPPVHTFHVSGTVRSASGPLSGAKLHIVYDVEAPAISALHCPLSHSTLDSAELVNFSLTPGDNMVIVRWQTASEFNIDHFEILRDGNIIAEINAANTATGLFYSYSDMSVMNYRTYHYELVSRDINGNSTGLAQGDVEPTFDSGIITEYALHVAAPNPVTDTAYVAIDLTEANHVTLTLLNDAGVQVATLISANMAAGRHVGAYPMAALPNGEYKCKLIAGSVFADSTWLVRNMRDLARLGTLAGIDTTDSTGSFGFDPIVGFTMDLRDAWHRTYGDTTIFRARVTATMDGYIPRDTLLDFHTLEHHDIVLQLSPQM